LYEATDGEVMFKGANVHGNKTRKDKLKFNRAMQMIFQDPYASLNPRMTLGDIIAEGIDIHGLAKSKDERNNRVYDLLETVGLTKEHASRYPQEFSGGQRQRIGIARALAVEPDFIIADEPISALDVSIQAQVVNLMKELQRDRSLTYLFIAHDLSMVKYISDRIGVMYQGHLVELCSADRLYENPVNAYTKSVLSAIPVPDPEHERTRKRIVNDGPTSGPVGKSDEDSSIPPLREIEPGHFVSMTDAELEAYLAQLV
jgi:oligopeptide transport system ATP-binding protein